MGNGAMDSGMDSTGRTVVVTGASRGLGLGLAQEFLAQGLDVAACARAAPPLSHGRCVTGSVDVTDAAAVERFAQEAIQRFGKIDLWVNNAGVLEPIEPLREVGADAFAEHVAINLGGVFHGTQSFVRHVRSRAGGGVLINISSGAARKAYAGWSAYCAAKAGVDRLTECVALEEADAGLRAFSVAPGVIDTDMQAAIRGATESRFPEVERFRQMKRDDAYSPPDFIAGELLALAFGPGSAEAEVCVRLRGPDDSRP